MPYQFLRADRDGSIERLTLNRPEVRNAFNAEMVAELTDWAGRTAADRAVRLVVLAGAGPVFSAGGDLAWMAKTVEFTEDAKVADALSASRMFTAIDTLPFPVVARIQGAALGGGSGLAAVCEIVVAEDSATFGFTEVKLGIIPAVISPFVLAKIGRSAARELFLTGRRFTAAHAREIGLVHAVVGADTLDAAVDGVVRELRSAGPEAVSAAKALIRDVWNSPPDEVPELTARVLARQRASEEGQHGLRAFLERRTPRWSVE